MTEGSDGALYGTTRKGGPADRRHGLQDQQGRDGVHGPALVRVQEHERLFPRAGVTEGSDGALYGTTQGGGAANRQARSSGSTRTGRGSRSCTRSSDGTDGCVPTAGVTGGSDGALYGTTSQGGAAGGGTVFRIRKDGTGFTVLHSFECASTDGCFPAAGVTEGSDGALYGTTGLGGAAGRGTVFRINKDGTGFTVLHSFGCTSTNGCGPAAGVTEGSDGALYGTTGAGGGGAGTVYRLVPARTR